MMNDIIARMVTCFLYHNHNSSYSPGSKTVGTSTSWFKKQEEVQVTSYMSISMSMQCGETTGVKYRDANACDTS